MIKKIAVSFLFAFVFLLLANYAGAHCTDNGTSVDYEPHTNADAYDHCDSATSLVDYFCVGNGVGVNTVSCTTHDGLGYCNGNKCAKYECNTFFDCPKNNCKNVSCTNHSCVVGSNLPSGTICSTGVCNGSGTCVTPSCSDSDSGITPNTRGTASGTGSDGYAYTVKDQCAGEGTVIEQFCNGISRAESWRACASGYKCVENSSLVGACEIPVTHTCTDSDGHSPYPDGKNPYEKGSIVFDGGAPLTDSCSGGTLREYYCNGTLNYGSSTWNCPSLISGGQCVDGKCIACNDSDYGNRPFYGGNTKYDAYKDAAYDHCNGNVLTEYFCNSDYTLGTEVKNCSVHDVNAVCVDNRCVMPRPTLSVFVTKDEIILGDSFDLMYNVKGADVCYFSTSSSGSGMSIAPGPTSISASSGGWGVMPTSSGTKTYRISCSNAYGTTIESDSVVVNSSGGGGNTAPNAVIDTPAGNLNNPSSAVNFSGHGIDYDLGDTITDYRWKLGGCGDTFLTLSSAASFSRAFSANGTYTIYFKVKDNHGTWSDCDSRTITVAALGDPTLNFYPENNIYTIPSGTGTTLHWTTTNVSTCTATGDWAGSKIINGSEPTGNLTASKTYTLECFKGSAGFNNSSGTNAVKQSVTISVSSCVPLCNNTTVCQGVPYLDAVCETPCMGTRNCCISKCTPSNLANICSGETVSDGCTAGLTCTGTKDCSWREVAP